MFAPVLVSETHTQFDVVRKTVQAGPNSAEVRDGSVSRVCTLKRIFRPGPKPEPEIFYVSRAWTC